jgi:hypothetical protein
MSVFSVIHYAACVVLSGDIIYFALASFLTHGSVFRDYWTSATTATKTAINRQRRISMVARKIFLWSVLVLIGNYIFEKIVAA